MKTLLIAILVLALSSLAFACEDENLLRCNPTSGQWTYEDSESVLKPNPATGQWTYEEPDSQLRCNPTTGTWEYVE